ncbi:MAG: START domain-containing protein [Leptospiraceae bacterium]|jgi:hypothetical protein|nr:START domain-containing protein [Leptospiraceae bacterium]
MKLAAKFGYVLVVIFTITFFSPVFAQATEWSQSKNKKGVQVFIRPFTGSNIDEFLGRTEVDASIAQIVSILSDPASCQTMYLDCRELKVLSGTDKKNIVYVRNGAPWPVNDRDVIFDRTFEQNDKNLITLMKMKRTESISKPAPSGVTRMDAFEGIWRITPTATGKVRVDYQSHFEPGGSVPQSLINAALTDIPFESLSNLRKLVEAGKHKDTKIDWIKEPKVEVKE